MRKAFYYFNFVVLSFLFPCALHANNFAYLIVDGATGKVMDSRRADELRSPASLTKKMTLYLIFEAMKAGKINLKTRFPISKLATSQEPCKLWLKVGQTISVKDIIYGLVTRSANDAAIAAAEGLAGSVEKFSAMMNQKSKELGMTRTKFHNPSGLPDKRQVTTAKDMMTLAQALYRNFPKEFAYFKTKTFNFNGRPVRNHNRMLNSFTGCDGIKTGFTFASRFNISVSAKRIGANGQPVRVFAVVLGGQTSASRDKKTAELMEKAFKKLNATPRMQKAVVTDEIDDLVNESDVDEPGEILEPVAFKKKTLARKTSQRSSELKDPVDDILNNSPVNVDINSDLPSGWVKPKPQHDA